MEDQEKNLIEFLGDYFKAAYEPMIPYHGLWELYWKYLRGNQWCAENKKYSIPEDQRLTVNLIHDLMDNSVARQTVVRPTVRRRPLLQDEDTIRGADFFNKIDPILWEEAQITDLLDQAIFTANLHHSTAFALRHIDPLDRHSKIGKYRLSVLDPFICYPDPSMRSSNLQKDCLFFFTAQLVPLAYIRLLWPEKADQVKALEGKGLADQRLVERFGETHQDNEPRWYQLIDSGTTAYLGNYRAEEFNAENYCTLYTCYLRTDFQKAEYKFWKKNTQGVASIISEEVSTPWRIINYTDNAILDDGPSRVYDGELPLLRLGISDLPGSPYGVDIMKTLVVLQDMYNEAWSYSMAVLGDIAHPRRYYEPTLIDSKTLLGSLLRKRKVTPVRGNPQQAFFADRPPEIAQTMLFIMREIPTLMERVVAQPEILQGINPSGARSAEALKILTVNAMPRTNKRTAQSEKFTKELTEKMALDFLTGLPLRVTREIMGMEVEYFPQDYMRLAITTEVVPGSSLPTYAQQKSAQLIEFMTSVQGLPPPLIQEMIKNSPIPEIRDLLNQGGLMQGLTATPTAGQTPGTSMQLPPISA